MEIALEEIIYNRDPPAELTNDLLGLGSVFYSSSSVFEVVDWSELFYH